MDLEETGLLGGFATLSAGYDDVIGYPAGDGTPSLDVFGMVNGFHDDSVGLHAAASFGASHDFFHGCDGQLFYIEGLSGPTIGKMQPGRYGVVGEPGGVQALSVSMENSVFSHSQVLNAVSTMQSVDTCVAVDDGIVALDDDDVMKYINTDSTESDFTESSTVFPAPVVFQGVPSSPVDIPSAVSYPVGYGAGFPAEEPVDPAFEGRENVVEMLNELCESLDDSELISNHAEHYMTADGGGSPFFDFDLPPMSPDDVDSLLSSSPAPLEDNSLLSTVTSSPVGTGVPPTLGAGSLLPFAVQLPADSVVPVSPGSSTGCPSPPTISTINLKDFLTRSPDFQASVTASPPPPLPSQITTIPASTVKPQSPPLFTLLPPASTPLTQSVVSYPSSGLSGPPRSGKSPSPLVTEKRQRKKEQNKTAALRYRHKKRDEHGSVMSEFDELERRNVELKTRVTEMTKEVDYLKGLIAEICA